MSLPERLFPQCNVTAHSGIVKAMRHVLAALAWRVPAAVCEPVAAQLPVSDFRDTER